MLIIIDAELSAPPSSVSCFRDVTLYSNCFLNADVLMECRQDEKDLYWKWLKSRGAFDFIEDIVRPYEERGFLIKNKRGNLVVDRIIESNLNFILNRLRLFEAFRG